MFLENIFKNANNKSMPSEQILIFWSYKLFTTIMYKEVKGILLYQGFPTSQAQLCLQNIQSAVVVQKNK